MDMDEDFFNQPEVNRALDEMERAIMVAKVMQDCHVGPTFNLGIGDDEDDINPKGILRQNNVDGTPLPNSVYKDVLDDSEDDVEDVMVRRRQPRRLKKLPFKLRSPFWTTKNNRLDTVTNKEELISDYAFLQDGMDKNELLFKSKYLTATRDDMLTLMEERWVADKVVNIWCCKLNLDNFKITIGQPKRIFLSTIVALQLDLEKDDENLQSSFERSIECELEIIGDFRISDVKMVFFAVLKEEHFWVLCVNFLSKRIEIIDNRTLPKLGPKNSRFDKIARDIAKCFSIYLTKRKVKNNVDRFPVENLKMSWRSSKNHVDCGIYCMRHMETYKGNLNGWGCGFIKDQDKELIIALRAKYCSSILTMEVNELKTCVMERAKKHMQLL